MRRFEVLALLACVIGVYLREPSSPSSLAPHQTDGQTPVGVIDSVGNGYHQSPPLSPGSIVDDWRGQSDAHSKQGFVVLGELVRVYVHTLPVVFCVLQAVIEGVRWQMHPVYCVAAALMVPAKHSNPLIVVSLYGLLLVSRASNMLFPVAVPPRPSGRHAVGTQRVRWTGRGIAPIASTSNTDATDGTEGGTHHNHNHNHNHNDDSGSRIHIHAESQHDLMVRLFYPAMENESDARATAVYFPGELTSGVPPDATIDALVETALGIPRGMNFVAGHVRHCTLRALEDATIARASVSAFEQLAAPNNTAPPAQRHLRCVVISHDDAEMASSHARLACELASHGFLVACVEHTDGSACVSVFPDGSAVTYRPAQGAHTVREGEERGNGQDSASASDVSKFRRAQLEQRTSEVAFVMDKLLDMDSGRDLAMFRGRLALDCGVGVFGVGLGGATALCSALYDQRVSAAVAVDLWTSTLTGEDVSRPCRAHIVLADSEHGARVPRDGETGCVGDATSPQERHALLSRLVFVTPPLRPTHTRGGLRASAATSPPFVDGHRLWMTIRGSTTANFGDLHVLLPLLCRLRGLIGSGIQTEVAESIMTTLTHRVMSTALRDIGGARVDADDVDSGFGTGASSPIAAAPREHDSIERALVMLGDAAGFRPQTARVHGTGDGVGGGGGGGDGRGGGRSGRVRIDLASLVDGRHASHVVLNRMRRV